MSLQQVGSALLRIILFMVVWAAILVAVLALGHGLGRTDDQLLVPLLVLIALILLTFFPYLNAVAQRVFAVPGEGPPVPPAELHRRLEELNTFDAPVMAQPKRWGYLFTWRYVDAKWWELFAQAGLTETYELRVKLDAAHHV